MAHNPGPWKIAETNQTDESIGADVHAASGYIGTFIRVLDDESTPEEIAEHLANARLIAAAPVMLAALEVIQDLAVKMANGADLDTDEAFDQIIEQASLAILETSKP